MRKKASDMVVNKLREADDPPLLLAHISIYVDATLKQRLLDIAHSLSTPSKRVSLSEVCVGALDQYATQLTRGGQYK